jgi:hypothetical protein
MPQVRPDEIGPANITEDKKDPLVEALTARAADLILEREEIREEIQVLEYEVRRLRRKLIAHDIEV